DPVWGKQVCGHCAMLVSDPRYAAQVLLKNGERVYFDDVGCMAAWETEHAGTYTADWVHDHDGAAWLKASTAQYRHGAQTPMDWGYTAHAPTVGDGVTWDGVRAHLRLQTGGHDDGRTP